MVVHQRGTGTTPVDAGFYGQNEMKGERGSPGLKGDKGEPGGGYYGPRFVPSGPPGQPGPPVSPQRRLGGGRVYQRREFLSRLTRVLKGTPWWVQQALRGHLGIQAGATTGSQDSQAHPDLLDLLEGRTWESPGTHVVSLRLTHTNIQDGL